MVFLTPVKGSKLFIQFDTVNLIDENLTEYRASFARHPKR
jgi:hypothetical protein